MLAQNKDVPADVWREFVRQYTPSPSLVGRVAEVHSFGAFLVLGDGIVGILHRSVWEREPTAGEQLRVRATSVDEQRRLSLAPA